jgi:hypothetical protein
MRYVAFAVLLAAGLAVFAVIVLRIDGALQRSKWSKSRWSIIFPPPQPLVGPIEVSLAHGAATTLAFVGTVSFVIDASRF